MCILYSERVVVSFLSASITSESPTNLRVCVCSVGCEGVISVFDAVAFLACAHRVSSTCHDPVKKRQVEVFTMESVIRTVAASQSKTVQGKN